MKCDNCMVKYGICSECQILRDTIQLIPAFHVPGGLVCLDCTRRRAAKLLDFNDHLKRILFVLTTIDSEQELELNMSLVDLVNVLKGRDIKSKKERYMQHPILQELWGLTSCYTVEETRAFVNSLACNSYFRKIHKQVSKGQKAFYKLKVNKEMCNFVQQQIRRCELLGRDWHFLVQPARPPADISKDHNYPCYLERYPMPSEYPLAFFRAKA